MKIIIYGTGVLLKKHIKDIDLKKITAFVDSDFNKWNQKLYGKTIFSPNCISKIEYDYIIIFSEKYLCEIYNNLHNIYGIEYSKIFSWQQLLFNRQNEDQFMIFEEIGKIINKIKAKKILDINLSLINMKIMSKNDLRIKSISHLEIDGFNFCGKKNYYTIYHNIYNIIIKDFRNLDKQVYDAILFINPHLKYTLSECQSQISQSFNASRYVIIVLPFSFSYAGWNEGAFETYGNIYVEIFKDSKFILIDKQKEDIQNNLLQIYIATHKKFIKPNFNIYTAIQGGKKINKDLGYIGDDTGENISELNSIINECTVMYWIWKNSKCNFVGLNHYRRYFLNNNVIDFNNLLTGKNAIEILDKYDIILPIINSSYPISVAEALKKTIDFNAYKTGMNLVEKSLKYMQPDYWESYQYVFNGYEIYATNLFVSRKEVIDKYCQWLFSIIEKPAREINVSSYDDYSKRVIGFFAERLFTVWLLKSNLKIKELPVYFSE